MGTLEQMPSPEFHKIYLEFSDMEARAKAMQVINELRESNPEVFESLQSIKIDEGRKEQGLELAFESELGGRTNKIVELLHQKGISLNMQDGHEETPYAA